MGLLYLFTCQKMLLSITYHSFFNLSFFILGQKPSSLNILFVLFFLEYWLRWVFLGLSCRNIILRLLGLEGRNIILCFLSIQCQPGISALSFIFKFNFIILLFFCLLAKWLSGTSVDWHGTSTEKVRQTWFQFTNLPHVLALWPRLSLSVLLSLNLRYDQIYWFQFCSHYREDESLWDTKIISSFST